jgi:hypothetical protein
MKQQWRANKGIVSSLNRLRVTNLPRYTVPKPRDLPRLGAPHAMQTIYFVKDGRVQS